MIFRHLLYAFTVLISTPACHSGPTSATHSAEIVIEEDSTTTLGVRDTTPVLNTSVDIDYLMGRFVPETHPDFIEIDTTYADRPGMFLRKEAYEAFISMFDAARKDGIRLQIRSATRTFGAQKYIWERKWTGETTIENGKYAPESFPDHSTRASMILKFSSMPGSSRHHWGTDIDLNAFNNSWFESGPGLEIYEWLNIHAGTYGFCQPYSAKGTDRLHGYEEERWHWSFMPLSIPFTKQAAEQLRDEMIEGFEGSHVAPDLQIIEKYVLGINSDCLE